VKTWHFDYETFTLKVTYIINSTELRTLLTVQNYVQRDGVISNGTFSSNFTKYVTLFLRNFRTASVLEIKYNKHTHITARILTFN